MQKKHRDYKADGYVVVGTELAGSLLSELHEEEDPILHVFVNLTGQLRPDVEEKTPLDVSRFDTTDLENLVGLGLIAGDAYDGYYIPRKIAKAEYFADHYKQRVN